MALTADAKVTNAKMMYSSVTKANTTSNTSSFDDSDKKNSVPAWDRNTNF